MMKLGREEKEDGEVSRTRPKFRVDSAGLTDPANSLAGLEIDINDRDVSINNGSNTDGI